MNVKQIDEQITDLKNIKILVQTYEEIAASRMQRIKASVLLNREFLSSLYKIYQHVKFSYDKRITKMKEKKGVLAKRGGDKSVAVLLTANTGLYGGIIQEVYDLFSDSVAVNTSSDVAVVGDIGRKLVERDKNKLGIKDYQYFEISDGTSDPSDFSNLVSYIVHYDNVDVYHGKFESLLNQIPIKENVTGELPESERRVVEEAEYIFEPSLESIVGFFESEIMASIFEQSIFESSLSKYASRMVNLDKAVVNITNRLERTSFKKQRIKHRDANKSQLDLLSSISLWS